MFHRCSEPSMASRWRRRCAARSDECSIGEANRAAADKKDSALAAKRAHRSLARLAEGTTIRRGARLAGRPFDAQRRDLAMQAGISDEELRELLPRLRRFAQWLTRDPSSADDLVQSCLERALSRGSSRDPQASLRAWLFTILYRQFVDSRRRSRRIQSFFERFREEPELAPSAEEAVIANASLEAFAKLSPDHRAILLMVTVEGFSYQQTADTLNLSLGTVMSRLSRARSSYRALIEGETGPAPLRRVK